MTGTQTATVERSLLLRYPEDGRRHIPQGATWGHLQGEVELGLNLVIVLKSSQLGGDVSY